MALYDLTPLYSVGHTYFGKNKVYAFCKEYVRPLKWELISKGTWRTTNHLPDLEQLNLRGEDDFKKGLWICGRHSEKESLWAYCITTKNYYSLSNKSMEGFSNPESLICSLVEKY